MAVDIEPPELSFRRPFDVDEVCETLKIKNPNNTAVVFKIKTTAPKQYCVRPNSGRIEPGGETDVTVLLQAMKQEPPPDVKCRDKFLVQSVAISSSNQFESVVSILDSTDKKQINEQKIRVNWLPADGSDGTNSTTLRATPNRQSQGNEVDTDGDVSRYFQPTGDNPQASTAPPPYTILSTDNTPAVKKASVSSQVTQSSEVPVSAPPTYEELKKRLGEANIKLREYANRETSGLRQRENRLVPSTSTETKGSAATSVRQGPDSAPGVPVRIVAILCLITFLMAYLFF